MHSASGQSKSLSLPMIALAGAVVGLLATTAFSPSLSMKAPGAEQVGQRPTVSMVAGEAVIDINGYIGGYLEYCYYEDRYIENGKSSETLGADLRALGAFSVIRVKINSWGGLVTEGTQMYNMLQAAKADGKRIIVEIGATCMSAATLIACAGDEIQIHSNSLYMIHEASDYASGTADEIRAHADYLDKVRSAIMSIYIGKNPSMNEANLTALLKKTTWYTGAEAVAAGWADTLIVTPSSSATMSFDLDSMPTDTASPDAKVLLGALKLTMAANPPAPTDDVAALRTEIAGLREEITALAAMVSPEEPADEIPPAPVAEEPPAPEPEIVDPPVAEQAPPADVVVLDRNNPTVAAIGRRAARMDRAQDFEDELLGGATMAQLQAAFLGQKAPAIETTGFKAPPANGGHPPISHNPQAYIDARKAMADKV